MKDKQVSINFFEERDLFPSKSGKSVYVVTSKTTFDRSYYFSSKKAAISFCLQWRNSSFAHSFEIFRAPLYDLND